MKNWTTGGSAAAVHRNFELRVFVCCCCLQFAVRFGCYGVRMVCGRVRLCLCSRHVRSHSAIVCAHVKAVLTGEVLCVLTSAVNLRLHRVCLVSGVNRNSLWIARNHTGSVDA